MTFLEEVRADRQPLAHVLKKHRGIRRIVEDLYPDRTHFIYELLQNAEDAGATQADFALEDNSVSFEHDGRPFTEEDIWGITDIGEGTKAGDDDKIGCFGVGFKAVFSYTETPHIWSPKFSFKISELVLPTQIDPKQGLGIKTRFEFPFNNPKKSASLAHNEVEAGLEKLAETTLLFLTHLKSIRWHIGDNLSGEVFKTEYPNSHIEIVKRVAGKTEASSHFLRLSQPVKGLEQKCVSVAFALDGLPNVTAFDPTIPLAKQLKIIPANPSRVAVSFPLDKEASGLRFHLHAPFVTPLDRASVKDTPANNPLSEQLAELAAVSLQTIRQMDLLTAEFMGVLPNRQDALLPRYHPVREAIIQEMNTKPLTPAHGKSYAPAKCLKQSKAALKDLLSLEDIEYLIEYEGEPPQWAIAASQKNSNADRFLAGLAITDWGIADLLAVLKEKAKSDAVQKPDNEFLAWLKAKPVEWHQEFYSLLNKELTDDDQLKEFDDLQIVRLGKGAYSIGRKCFFPIANIEHDEKFPRVAKGVYSSGKSSTQQKEARDFLESIGVREVGESEEVEEILKKRYQNVEFDPNIEDLPRWVALVEKDPNKAKLFHNHFIFKRDDDKWATPGQVFLDKPFIETGLSVYYDALRSVNGPADNAVPRALATVYEKCGVTVPRLVKFAKAVGVSADLQSINDLLQILPYIQKSVEAKTPDMAAIAFIWRSLTEHGKYNRHLLEDSYQHHKGWGHYETRYNPSSLCYRLKSQSWVPQQTPMGITFMPPAQASRELLPDGFTFDSGWFWLRLLCFSEQAAKKVQKQQEEESEATSIGFPDAKSLARAKRFAALPLEVQERILAERENSETIELPDKESPHPDRRADRVAEKAKDAPERETEKRLRSVSLGLGDVKDECEQYLRHQYTNQPDGEMICQICQAALPFKLAGGFYYFEKVEFLRDLKKHHYQNYLALCPNHSAMFRYANTTQAKLKGLFCAMTSQRLDVVLAQTSFSIYFTNTHIADLKKVIEVDAAPEPSAAPTPTQTIHKPSMIATPARNLPNGLVQCPQCQSQVRPDRLQNHIAKVHTNRPSVRPKPHSDLNRNQSNFSISRCRSCGRPAMPGDDYCYSCRP